MIRLERFLALPNPDKRLLLRALLTVAAVRLGLWALPLKTVLRRVAGEVQKEPAHLGAPGSKPNVSKPTWAVAASSRFVPRASCLTQALAAQVLLARHGANSEVRIGVARDPTGEFKAHAWLEHQGEVILGDRSDLLRYLPLPSLELLDDSSFSSQAR